ncbi:MAG: LPXTG cell wall anchor domain-containing protein [Candidatus Dormibacteraeota bacterium]|nr:LPXTG cell wall anchor domain-containing protein [Candidatus Dormibacteraeota bacterium]
MRRLIVSVGAATVAALGIAAPVAAYVGPSTGFPNTTASPPSDTGSQVQGLAEVAAGGLLITLAGGSLLYRRRRRDESPKPSS